MVAETNQTTDVDTESGGAAVLHEAHSEIAGNDAEPRLRALLEALKAVTAGDFSVRLSTARNGLVGEIAEAFNDLVAVNEKVTKEIMRVSQVVGEEGKLTEQASLEAIAGGWKTGIDSINSLIRNLAQPTTEVARVITAVAQGDLSDKVSLDIEGRSLKGEFLRLGTTVNTMVDSLNTFGSEVTRVAREVGVAGRLGAQAERV